MLKESQQWGLIVAPFPLIIAPHGDRMNLEYKVKLFALCRNMNGLGGNYTSEISQREER